MNPTQALPPQSNLCESNLWPGARDILHFVGVNGAGKSTLGKNIAGRCAAHGGKVIFDSERRAYNAAFDRANAGRTDSAIHRQVVDGALALINEWKRSDANVVIVDRWYESYDFQLPPACLEEIEAAIAASGFRMTLIHLVVGKDILSDDFATMSTRMTHTKANRPEAWWATGTGTFDERVQEECDYQSGYRRFCERAPFSTTTICTTAMDWASYENAIVESVALGRLSPKARALSTVARL
jgi:energy-coupling factor transporter ATP-binding protein EcfA2